MLEKASGSRASETRGVESIQYRPAVLQSLVSGGVWLVTAIILAWLGKILGPEDTAAMEGFTLLLFTVVPIRLFCWTAALILAGMSGYLLRRGLGGSDTTEHISSFLFLRSISAQRAKVYG